MIRRGSLPLALVVLAACASLAAGRASPPKSKPLCLGKRATIVGTAGADVLRGTKRADVIAALGGNDVVDARAGTDLVCGGPGFDVCRAGEKLTACEETRRNAAPGPLEPGQYTTDVFRPRLSFRVGSGWQVRYQEPAAISIHKQLDPGGQILELDSFGGRRSVAARLAQFSSIAGTEVTGPVAATIGGAAGQRVDLLVTATDIVAVPGLTDRYELEPNDRLRVYVVSVKRVAVAVLVEAPDDEFAAFSAGAEAVLASLRWS